MEYKNTEHDPNSNDYEEMFEVKESVGPNQYFLQEPEKSVKVEYEGNGLDEDRKNDHKNKRTAQINNENYSKTFICSDESTKPTDNLKVEATSKSLLLNITQNLVSQLKVEKQSDKEERLENNDLNLTNNSVSEDYASNDNQPLTEELRNNTEKKRYTCVHCGFSTVWRSGFVVHLLIHSDKRPFVCAHCNYRTVRKTSLIKHIKAMHLPKNSQDLNRTNNTISEDNASNENQPLTEELRNNTEKKRHTCVHCGYSTVRRSGLVEHLVIHSDERPFVCAHCDYRTVRKTCLSKHIKAMHLPKNSQNSQNNTANTIRRKSFQCVSCDASYDHQYSLIRHIRQHHNESGNTDKHNIPRCKICNFSSSNPFVLKNHVLTHSPKSFRCDECQISYSRNDILKRHRLNFHTTEILYQCKSCDRKFETEFHLLRHEQSLKCAGTGKPKTSTPNNLKQQFKCTNCAKTFAYKSVLDLHLLTHTRQYTFKCSLCAEGFPTYTTLRYHIYSHSKESLYKCSVCNFSTDHQTTMKTHEANHTKQNTYSCTDCNYSTKKGNLFLKHREEHNYGKGKFQCAHCNYSTDIRDCIIQHFKFHSL